MEADGLTEEQRNRLEEVRVNLLPKQDHSHSYLPVWGSQVQRPDSTVWDETLVEMRERPTYEASGNLDAPV